MMSPSKPNKGRPAMPATPLARRGLEKDSVPCKQVRGPTGATALDVLVESIEGTRP